MADDYKAKRVTIRSYPFGSLCGNFVHSVAVKIQFSQLERPTGSIRSKSLTRQHTNTMKLDDETTQQIGEIDLAALGLHATDRESPSSFNKSMDFARHTKRSTSSLRNPPSRECSNDKLGASGLLGESFFGDSFAGCSFAMSDGDDHDDIVAPPRAIKRPDLETVIDLEDDEGQRSLKDCLIAEGGKAE